MLVPFFFYDNSLVKALMLGKIAGRRRRGQQRMRCLYGITDSMGPELEHTPGDCEGQERLACCSPWAYRDGHD